MGDFNVILYVHEKTGPFPQRISCDKFRSCIELANLVDIPLKNAKYPWAKMVVRSYVERRLDHALCSFALPQHHYDHYPILLKLKLVSKGGPCLFHYQAMRLFNSSFKAMVGSS